MKRSNKPIRLPDDFRETVSILNLDPLKVMQKYIDETQFYYHFRKLKDAEQFDRVTKLRCGMLDYQVIGRDLIDHDLLQISNNYLSQLSKLSYNDDLSDEEEGLKSKELIREWEKQAAPLLNCPRELVLEGGGILKLTFDFMLVCMIIHIPFRKCISGFMQRISLSFLHAHQFSDAGFNNERILEFFESLFDDEEEGIMLVDNAAQLAIRKEYEPKFVALKRSMEYVRNFKKRLPVFRAFQKEWYSKLMEIN